MSLEGGQTLLSLHIYPSLGRVDLSSRNNPIHPCDIIRLNESQGPKSIWTLTCMSIRGFRGHIITHFDCYRFPWRRRYYRTSQSLLWGWRDYQKDLNTGARLGVGQTEYTHLPLTVVYNQIVGPRSCIKDSKTEALNNTVRISGAICTNQELSLCCQSTVSILKIVSCAFKAHTIENDDWFFCAWALGE